MRLQYKIGITLASSWIIFNILFWPWWRQYWYLTKEQISAEKVVQKWGISKKFEAKKFKEGSDDVRTAMVGDLIQSKYYIGKPMKIVFGDLGNGEHSPLSDIYFNYKLRDSNFFWNDNADYWLWFYEDNHGLIKELVVYEYCCSNPYATYLHYKGWLSLK